MTREQLEKDFDDEFGVLVGHQLEIDKMNQFIFEQMIPKVLKSLLREVTPVNERYLKDWNKGLKIQAKEKFGIDL